MVSEGQCGEIGANRRCATTLQPRAPAAQQAGRRCGTARHLKGKVHAGECRTRVALTQAGQRAAGGAAQVQRRAHRKLDVAEPLQHAHRHFAMQRIALGKTGGSAITVAP